GLLAKLVDRARRQRDRRVDEPRRLAENEHLPRLTWRGRRRGGQPRHHCRDIIGVRRLILPLSTPPATTTGGLKRRIQPRRDLVLRNRPAASRIPLREPGIERRLELAAGHRSIFIGI